MPCPGKEPSKQRGAQVSDLLELHGFTANSTFYPDTKAELVIAVAASGQEGRPLRALGTNWSLSKAAVAQSVVSTWKLDKHLSQPFPVDGLAPGRLRDPVSSTFLREVCTGDDRAAGRQFVHVEAGVQIRTLLGDLKSCGLSLPTMGNGAGQSLAGALSTATHGADFHTQLLVEWIRAVHLIGPGGQEWWITPEASLFANEAVLKLQDWCDDARIVANDDAFNAVRVGVGRMGVIYSMVLEVERAYNLVEVNLEHAWSEIRSGLKVSVAGVNAGMDTGILDAPLTGLESGWFRSQVLSRTEGSLFHPAHYKPGPSHAVPPPSPSLDKQYLKILQDLGLADLARGLRGAPTFPLRHINIAVNLARPTQCWARRMWRPPDSIHIPPVPPPPEKPNFFMEAVTRHKRDPEAMLDALFEALSKESFWVLLASRVGRIYLERWARRTARQSKAAGATSGETLFLMLYILATNRTLGPFAKPHIIDVVSDLIGGGFSDLVLAGLATDLLDKHNYELDGAQSGNSAEFFFDASSEEYLGFIDEVIALVQLHSPVFGFMGIRFTPGATALIAMQRFPMTVSVEVATARSRLKDVYGTFWTQLHQAANKRRAIPHWGQEFRQSAPDIEAHYGQNLLTWRRMLSELSIDGPSTFSTTFSQEIGLEPKGAPATGIFDSDSVDQFLAGLAAGVE
jgi:hypothetical protein